jgi:cobalt-zinc-cadmium efflux system outer membrane protein
LFLAKSSKIFNSFNFNQLSQGTVPALGIPSERGAALRYFDFPTVIRGRAPWVPVLLCLLVAGASLAETQDAANPGTEGAFLPADPVLEDYLAAASAQRPILAADRGRADALRSNAQVAGAMPGLKLGWGEMIVPVETRVGPQQRVLSISQRIPWFGTLGHQSDAAEARADAAVENLRGRTLIVRRDVRAAWFELAYLHGSISAVAANLELARQAEEVTRSAYESGSGSYADVLTAQIELGKLDTRLAGLRDRLKPSVVRLNTAAGLDPSTPAPASVVLADEPILDELPDESEMTVLLDRYNPELAARRLDLEGRRRDVDVAGKSAYPELALGLDYIMTGEAAMEGVEGSGKDPVIARVAVTIPLWGGQADAKQKTSAGLVRAAGSDLADARLRLHAQLEDVHFALRDAERQERLYADTMISRGQQALDVTMARYASSQASFQDVIAARRTLLDLELSRLRAATDRRLAANDLITLLGVDPATINPEDG